MEETMNIGIWKIPSEMFDRYLRLIKSTERSSQRYNYEFDQLRQNVHWEIMDYVGLIAHTNDYAVFQRALHDLCEEMLPDRFPPPKATKLTPPYTGLTGRLQR